MENGDSSWQLQGSGFGKKQRNRPEAHTSGVEATCQVQNWLNKHTAERGSLISNQAEEV